MYTKLTIVAAGLAGTVTEDFQLWGDGEEAAVYISRSSGALATGDEFEFFGEINNGKLGKELYPNPDY